MFDRARWRLTLWFTGVFAVILIVICATVFLVARQSALDQVRDDLKAQATAALNLNSEPPERPGAALAESAAILRALSATGSFYVFVDDAGAVLQGSEGVDSDTINLPDQGAYEEEATANNGAYVSASTDDGDQLRVFVMRAIITRPALGNQPGYLMIGKSVESELQALRRLALILFAGAVIGLLLAAYGGFWLAGRALKPIQTSMDAQRKFVADASHELRTPLSLIRANAEMVKRAPDRPPDPEYLDDILKETDRLAYLVGQMLTLARADSSGATFEREPVDMSVLAEDITRRMKLLAADKDISLDAHTNGSAAVYGDEQRLGELLLILLDNSIKYTDRGGKVDVTVSQENRHVQIAVADNGRGIPPDALPQVFERFYRADKARSREMGGSGLGLAIAKWITDGHSGRLDIKSTSEQGTTVTVELPAA